MENMDSYVIRTSVFSNKKGKQTVRCYRVVRTLRLLQQRLAGENDRRSMATASYLAFSNRRGMKNLLSELGMALILLFSVNVYLIVSYRELLKRKDMCV